MIISTSNQQIKNVVHLQRSSKERKKQNAFVVEGPRMVRETPGNLLHKIYVTEEFMDHLSAADRNFLSDITDASCIETVSDSCMKAMSDTVHPQGIIAIVDKPDVSMDIFRRKEQVALLCLENIQDAGNLGTMVRTAEAAGMDGILLSENCVDVFSPKVVRSTMGSLYRVPVIVLKNFITEMKQLKLDGYTIYAAHLDDSLSFDEVNYQRKSAVMIGNEGNGLTEEATTMSDVKLHIPMLGQVESLNAAMAAGLLMYEIGKCRRGEN